MSRYSEVLSEKQLATFLQECEDWQVSSHTGSPSDKQVADEQLTTLASYAIPELVQEVRDLRATNARLVEETHTWSKSVKKLEAERTQPFTEASTEDALAILDYMATNSDISDKMLSELIDAAIQKLRPAPAPVHDAAALEQLAQQHPIDLPWMKLTGPQVCGNCGHDAKLGCCP